MTVPTDMPQIGFGLWKVAQEDCAAVIGNAVEAGYRHFDCAADYANEAAVGAALKDVMAQGTVSREDLWITSKLWNTYHHPDHVRPALMRTLQDMQLDHLDLYLVHFPIALAFVPFETRYPPEWVHDPDAEHPVMKRAAVPLHETWGAMEELVSEGLVRKIGVCNYNTALIHDLMAYARTAPSVLQVESHPYLTQEKLIRTAKDYGMEVTAFSPLGALSYLELDMAGKGDIVLKEPVVEEIARAHGKTPAQVVLRWNVQRGLSIIPKTTKPERMRENLALFDFELSSDQMQAISGLNRNRRFNDPGVFCEAGFNTFHAIYE